MDTANDSTVNLLKQKAGIRNELLELRSELSSADKARQSLLLGSNVAAFLDARKLPDGMTVAAYSAMPDELSLIPTCALLYQMGATVAFPCVHSHERMEFYALSATDLADADTAPAFYANPTKMFPESACAAYPLVEPESLDLMLVPGVGFDRNRNRIGYGWGCYDRYLSRVPSSCIRVGVCFDAQLVEKLPVGPDDRPLDYIITPTVAY